MKKGFTLLELLIVIIILGILFAVALPRYFANIENARKTEAEITLRSLREADLAEYARNGAYFTAPPTAAAPWTVDIDGDLQDDISVTPNTTYFSTYTLAGAGTTASIAANSAGIDYYMCVQSGIFGSGAASCP